MRKEKKRRLLRRVSVLLLAVLLLFSGTPFGRRCWEDIFWAAGFRGGPREPLAIHFLNVEKADAVLIVCDGHAALLDGGEPINGEQVVDYMLRSRVESLDYVIASHGDSDHIGGLPLVFSEMPVDAFLRSPYFPEQYRVLDTVRERFGVPQRLVYPGDTFSLGEAVLHVLGPVREYAEPNNASLVLRLDYGDFSALFCGDLEKQGERDLIKSGADLSADVLKASHHGSKTSSTKRFLQEVNPEYVVVSTGVSSAGLPDAEALQRLEENSAMLYRTDVDGTVTVTYGSGGIKVITEK